MARFVIADITDPSSIPHELATIIPQLMTTPIRLIKQEGSEGYSMINDYVWDADSQAGYRWVIKTYEYIDGKSLINELDKVIAPANELAERYRNLKP